MCSHLRFRDTIFIESHVKVIWIIRTLSTYLSRKSITLGRKKWLELLKDYDCMILYHPRKANIVLDALSRKCIGSLSHIAKLRRSIIKEILKLELSRTWFKVRKPYLFLVHVELRLSLVKHIKVMQVKDPQLSMIKEKIKKSKDVISI